MLRTFLKKTVFWTGPILGALIVIIVISQYWPKQEEDLQNLATPQQNIILNALPKSGSAYMQATLAKSLDYKVLNITSEYIPQDQVIYKQIREFYVNNKKISKQHMDASPLNVQILKRFTNKMVLHVRDPREVLLSWVHHLNALKQEKSDLFYFTPEPPPGYYDLSLHEQIDWNIENFLPAMVQWLDAWALEMDRQASKEHGLKILLTTYEELLTDELKLYHKILAFYGIPQDRFVYAPINKDRKVHYRKGDPNEWRQVFTEQQKQKIASIIPKELLQRFNWSVN